MKDLSSLWVVRGHRRVVVLGGSPTELREFVSVPDHLDRLVLSRTVGALLRGAAPTCVLVLVGTDPSPTGSLQVPIGTTVVRLPDASLLVAALEPLSAPSATTWPTRLPIPQRDDL